MKRVLLLFCSIIFVCSAFCQRVGYTRFTRRMAENGNKNAMYHIGMCQDEGIGVKKDKGEAFSWFLKAAEAGHATAMGKVGYAYMEGIYADDDPVLGLKWIEKGISLKDPYCIYTLGKCYEEGTGLDEDINKALQWYEKAAEFGSTEAMNELGMQYYEGDYVDKDVNKAIMWYKKAADLGDTEAMKSLASLYSDEDKEEEAVAWYKKAAEKGDTRAMVYLGLHYGCPQAEQAIIWYRKAAELGDADGCEWLGLFYKNGVAVEEDSSKAIYWYKKALEINPDLESPRSNLVNLGVPDTDLLFYTYETKKKALEGDCNSMLITGLAYLVGKVVETDMEEGAFWLRKATTCNKAELSLISTIWERLGHLYRLGHGVEKSNPKAVHCFMRAYKLDPNNKKAYDDLEKMSSMGVAIQPITTDPDLLKQVKEIGAFIDETENILNTEEGLSQIKERLAQFDKMISQNEQLFNNTNMPSFLLWRAIRNFDIDPSMKTSIPLYQKIVDVVNHLDFPNADSYKRARIACEELALIYKDMGMYDKKEYYSNLSKKY